MMRACLIAVLWFAAGAATAATTVSIEVLPHAVVPGGAVVLGQVAHLRSTDLDLMRKLVDLPVARAPRAGEEASVDMVALAASIRRGTGLGSDRLAWSGAAETRVVRDSTRVSGEQIAGAALNAVVAMFAASGGTAPELHVAITPRDIQLPRGDVRLQARAVDGARLRSRTLVWVDIWSGATHVRTVAVPVEGLVRPFAGAAGTPQALPGAAAVPPAHAGQEAPLAVTRGQWAALRMNAGVVALESSVEVLQDGRPGDKVRVRQKGATGIVFARVVGRGELELAP